MTIEEAVKDIKENIQPSVGGKSLEMAIVALEKQIPKKPIEIDTWGKYYKCPICDKYAVDNLGCKYKFCRDCGQRIDWKVEE